EQSVLGTIFLDPKEIVSVVDQLNNEDFFEQAHQMIYEAMKDLHNNTMKIDYTSVAAKLEEGQNLQKAGGMKYLLALSETVPSTKHLETYVELVRDGSMKRQVIQLASEILETGYSGDMDANEYLTIA